ncbi:MAG: type II toxin-antitoxin system prevent-host-death family antitoxin [Proteobacteria bacterium]|nr:type II toxin-antitoxin system prevent-host-death family antitoxin [Desulfobacterales bacterium]MBL6967315.1 type II toxin-antitoxin system prevent-host-death family antitoxin [Desulfobacteraceae bacterium]MBU0735722.1 type II toxin-antitoxin system prevent-host-death family antitoxin [Pseudomonadota bacterium]MBL7102052.1 type II toxin-antitoxin system prevent-host-death family antitoxin [Desulfobacteraceae bacterium]MBL7172091.1 type II toxin-antitoxin system prevent-host-death family anti
MEINAAEFRANCFKILDQVKVTHKEVVITKRGKPIAKLVHVARQNEKDPLLGSMEGLVETIGDLTRPVIDPDAWELD